MFMEQEIKIIKRLILYGGILLVVALLANINSEKTYIAINSPIVSNNLVLTLAGGICTGITAVLLEKIFKYRLDKSNIIKNMYYDAVMIYSELYYWSRNAEELCSNRKLPIPENLFSNNLPLVNSYICRLRCCDYSCFGKRDSVGEALDIFKQKDLQGINDVFSCMNYFRIAIAQSKINELETGVRNKDDIYRVLTILDNMLICCEEGIENLIKELDKADTTLRWEKDKEVIINGYFGVYGKSLEEFIGNAHDINP